jgi:hypothetical protein
MTVANFIPDLWAAALLRNLNEATVAGSLCNRDYEGEVRRMGDSVKITSITQPTIGSYTSYSDISWEDIDDATRSLLIDQQKYFAFELDDVDRAQVVSDGNLMAEAMYEASFGLRDVFDTFLFTTMEAGVSTTTPDHYVAEQTISTASDAYELLVDMAVLLDEANVPTGARWVAVTPAFHGLLLKDSRFVSAGDERGAQVRYNGEVGSAAGLSIVKSNNLPDGDGSGAGKAIIAGYRGATTVAEQITSVEAVRRENRFSDGVKGLHVYGAKVTRPTGLVVADVIVA